MNRENLRILANYLIAGQLKADFHMGIFSLHPSNYYSWGFPAKEMNCGTSGCAVGHGPYAGICKKDDEGWAQYSHRVFIDLHSREWKWCFHPQWSGIDNTAEGAGKRILWLLEKGLPDDWQEQMFGRAELCYRKEELIL